MSGYTSHASFAREMRKFMRRRGLPYQSAHRKARALRFLYRHPNARGHAAIIRRLERERAARESFRAKQFNQRGY